MDDVFHEEDPCHSLQPEVDLPLVHEPVSPRVCHVPDEREISMASSPSTEQGYVANDQSSNTSIMMLHTGLVGPVVSQDVESTKSGL